MRLLLIGAPGSGKGTQSTALASLYGVDHISSGEVLRVEARAGTPLGGGSVVTSPTRESGPP